MAHPNADTLKRIDEPMASGDLVAFFDYYTDDVHVHVHGKNKLGFILTPTSPE